MLNILKNSILVLLLSNLVACSYSPNALKEIYNELPNEIMGDLTEGIDLSDQQTASVNSYANDMMKWHRQHKLPEYSQTFMQLDNIISQPEISISALKAVFANLDNIPHFDQAKHLTPKIEEVARSLSKDQIAQLERHLNDQNQKEAIEIRNEKLSSEIADTMKMMLGFIDVKLNDEQNKIINAESHKFLDTRKYHLQAEKVWNSQLINLLSQGPDNNQSFSAIFAKLWNQKDSILAGNVRKMEQQNDHLMALTIKTLVKTFDNEQRETLHQTLISMANTFNEMANE